MNHLVSVADNIFENNSHIRHDWLESVLGGCVIHEWSNTTSSCENLFLTNPGLSDICIDRQLMTDDEA